MRCILKNLFILIQILVPYESIASVTVLDKGLVSLQKNTVGLQFYIDIENKDRLSGCTVHSWTDNCCLTDGEVDCDTMLVHGGYCFVKPKDRETLIFIYPSMYQHDQVGYCDFVLDYRCGRNRRSKRQKVEVAFDTRVFTEDRLPNPLVEHYADGESTAACGTLDQDCLHDCEPVNCDMKYGGKRGYYDGYIGKCVETSICEADPDKEMPEVVYIPSTNACRDLEHPLTVADIYAISTGMGVVKPPTNSNLVKVEVRSNCSTISQNLKLIRDIMYGRLCPMSKSDMSDYRGCCQSAVWSILACIGSVCALLLSLFCLVQTFTWLHKKYSRGELNNFLDNFRNKFKAPKGKNLYDSGVNSEVRNTLLREVIVKDIPMELRESIVNICERMEKNVKKKKRYRRKDIGSQISLNQVEYDVRASMTSSTSSIEECEERQTLLK